VDLTDPPSGNLSEGYAPTPFEKPFEFHSKIGETIVIHFDASGHTENAWHDAALVGPGMIGVECMIYVRALAQTPPGGTPPTTPSAGICTVTAEQIADAVAAPVAPKEPVRPAGKLTKAQEAGYKKRLKDYEKKKAKYDAKKAAYDRNAAALVEFLNSDEAMTKYGINTPERRAAFVGQISEESAGLTTTTEERSSFPSSASRYKGRGVIQLTNEGNYRAASKAIFGDDRLVRDPGLVATDAQLGARIAGWYWNQRKATLCAPMTNTPLTTDPVTGENLVEGKDKKGKTIYKHFSLNELADRGDYYNISLGVNGFNKKIKAPNGLQDRIDRTSKALTTFQNCSPAPIITEPRF
jgi:putative chitinase